MDRGRLKALLSCLANGQFALYFDDSRHGLYQPGHRGLWWSYGICPRCKHDLEADIRSIVYSRRYARNHREWPHGIGRIHRHATFRRRVTHFGNMRLASNRLVVQLGHPRVSRKCLRSLRERFFAGCRRSSARSLGDVSARVVLFMEKTYFLMMISPMARLRYIASQTSGSLLSASKASSTAATYCSANSFLRESGPPSHSCDVGASLSNFSLFILEPRVCLGAPSVLDCSSSSFICSQFGHFRNVLPRPPWRYGSPGIGPKVVSARKTV